MHIQKHILKDLSKIAEDPEKQAYADYVMMVLGGSKKSEALKACFPDRYDLAVERADGNQNVINANVTKQVRQLERTKIVAELFEKSHKTWWIEFLEKKHKIYENLYGLAMDEGVIPRDRIAASKVMLEHMPVFNENKQFVDEVKETAQDFVSKLKDMQRKLYQTANNTEKIEAIEAEIVKPS